MGQHKLIDDGERIRLLYAEALSEEGHEVISLALGDTVPQAVDRFQPEVVVLDIQPGGRDGLEWLELIRNSHLSLPIFLRSAYDTYKEDPRTMTTGYYVAKSFDLSERKITIQNAAEVETVKRPAV